MPEATNLPNYRIYDKTGGCVTKDIFADSLDDAIVQGREWIEEGDWGTNSDDDETETCKTIELECEVGEIIYRPELPEIPSVLLAEILLDPKWDVDGKYFIATVSPDDAERMITELQEITDGKWAEISKDADGDIVLTWSPPEGVQMEEDEEATRDAATHDCSGKYSDTEPDCPIANG